MFCRLSDTEPALDRKVLIAFSASLRLRLDEGVAAALAKLE
jgi:hypothetical protein